MRERQWNPPFVVGYDSINHLNIKENWHIFDLNMLNYAANKIVKYEFFFDFFDASTTFPAHSFVWFQIIVFLPCPNFR